MILDNKSLTALQVILSKFKIDPPTKSIEIFGKGNVNDTFLVSTEPPDADDYVLQKLNGKVFPHPDWILKNQLAIYNHIDAKKKQSRDLQIANWIVPKLIPAKTGQFYFKDESSDYWRLTQFVPDTLTFERVDQPEDAYETGRALGLFHKLINDLPLSILQTPIEDFHNTSKYLERYQTTCKDASQKESTTEEQFCHRFIQNRTSLVAVLETARKDGVLSLHPIHGDPKIDNVLFNSKSRRAVGMIDLDTVSPGLLQFDIGDCLRSCCNRLGEDSPSPKQVAFDLNLAKALLSGYFEAARSILSDNDVQFIFEAVRLISFELGLRFFTDHLAGNRYFKVNHPQQNLNRSMVQFYLTKSIEANKAELNKLVDELWRE